jgi:voltage-gated potassium channel
LDRRNNPALPSINLASTKGAGEPQISHVPEIPGENQRRLNRAIWLLVGILALGTGGLMWLEGWDFWRALCFTLITVTTVGYGDEGISELGQRFTIPSMVGGIGTASYTFALVVQAMVTNKIAWRRRMQSRIENSKAMS